MFRNGLHLYKKAQGGNIKAFEVLFKRFYVPLCSYVYRFTESPDFSEGIVQELFFILWRDRPDLHTERSVRSYLYESVRKRTLRYLEHQQVLARCGEEVKMQGLETTPSFSPEDDAEASDLEKRLSEILLGFPERRRRIFYMHRFGGDRYSEIAKKLSISVKTVEGEMHRALKALRVGLLVL